MALPKKVSGVLMSLPPRKDPLASIGAVSNTACPNTSMPVLMPLPIFSPALISGLGGSTASSILSLRRLASTIRAA